VPYLLVTMVIAAYQSTRSWGDIVAMVLVSILGWIMQRLDWPRPAVIVGFVLSVPTERYLHLSMGRYGFEWLHFPGVIAIGVGIALVVILGVRSALTHDHNAAPIKM
jgi:TctA family transporter